MPIEYIDSVAMELICHRMAVAFFDEKDDPIPPFSEHKPELLQSALHLPKATFGGTELYPTLLDKAAALYYSLIKNHAFPNGNKRLATTALLVFFFLNDHWIQAPPAELAEQAIKVAASSPSDRDQILQDLKHWLETHLISAN